MKSIQQKITLVRIRKHRIVKKKTGIAHPYLHLELFLLTSLHKLAKDSCLKPPIMLVLCGDTLQGGSGGF